MQKTSGRESRKMSGFSTDQPDAFDEQIPAFAGDDTRTEKLHPGLFRAEAVPVNLARVRVGRRRKDIGFHK